MIPQSVKPADKLSQKSEVSPYKKQSRHPFQSNLSTCKTKPEILSSSKSSSGPFPPNVPPKCCVDRPKEDHNSQLKLPLMDFIPLHQTNNASQSVQDLIQQVSKFIEKKNPFRVIPEKKCCPDSDKPENALKNQMLRDDPRISNFDKNTANIKPKKYPEIPKALEKTNRISESTQVSKSKTIVSPGIGAPRGPLNSPPKTGKASYSMKTGRFIGVRTDSKRDLKEKPSLKVVGSSSRFEGWDNAETPSSLPLGVGQKPNKRPGRSEIPLRKTRTGMSKNPKHLSLLLQKPLKDNDSKISIDFYPKKPFTPINETSEMQSLNATRSSENLTHFDIKNNPKTLKKDVLLEETCNGFKLGRCFKNANIPVDSSPSCRDIADQKLCVAKRSKILDLDKVRTYSFTVLQNSREALCRLESLHQQNVSTKESVFGEKLNSSKLKILSPKPSFNSLKGKGSKKNLSTRLSSKGNKPALKIKTRKPKKDLDESAVSLKKTKTAQPDVSRKATVPADPSGFVSAFWRGGEHQKVGESDSGSLSGEYREIATGEEVRNRLIPEGELKEFEKDPKFPRTSSKKLGKHFDDEEVDQNEGKEKAELTPAPLHAPDFITSVLTAIQSISPEDRQTDEDERSSSKTVTLGKLRTDEMSSVSSEDSQVHSQSPQKTSSTGCQRMRLTVTGSSLKFGDELPERPEGSEPKKNKLHIKINLISPEDTDCEENGNETEDLERLYLNSGREDGGEQLPREKGSSEMQDKKEVEMKNTPSACALSRETAEKKSLLPSFPKSRKSSPFLRSRLQYKVSGANLKGVRKKIRSDAGDRRLPSSTGFFKSVSLQNKMKLDTKLRSGFTKAYIREEKRDLFDDHVPIKLKRRNSEPISFRGYIWKRADSVTPRGHKASVSSMASSLKHLNTDDIDDFIFWEAVPQKMTACWEMSLYHFKRPWSVLSCSVFEDNRQSSTPGLILENLRNGGSLSPRRCPIISNEGASRPKDNPFDVEPSIAQKNIDIRNWLAALNFPTPPSTSIDVISEGNFSTQSSLDAEYFTKGQVNQKRRKVLASLRFSEETIDKKADDKANKYKKSGKWDASEVGGLMDLIRRKSGGFVTNEQFLNSEHSIHGPNVTVNLCLYSKTPEEKPLLRECNDRTLSSQPKTFKTRSKSPSPEVKPTRPTAEVEPLLLQDVPPKMPEDQQFCWGRLLKGELALLPSDLNIWKYLFLLTLLIISVHYSFLNNNIGSS